jgi:hypothetical protein
VKKIFTAWLLLCGCLLASLPTLRADAYYENTSIDQLVDITVRVINRHDEWRESPYEQGTWWNQWYENYTLSAWDSIWLIDEYYWQGDAYTGSEDWLWYDIVYTYSYPDPNYEPPTGGGGGGGELTWEDLIPPERRIGADLYVFEGGGEVFSYARPEFETRLGALRGAPIAADEQALLDKGCIGVSLIATKYTYPNGTYVFLNQVGVSVPEGNRPDRPAVAHYFGEAKGFRTLAQAQAGSPGPGRRRVIFFKSGAWKNDTPPVDVPGGEPGQIPADSVVAEGYEGYFNYVTLINGKWVGMDHGVTDGPQDGRISDKPPTSWGPHIWIRRDILN